MHTMTVAGLPRWYSTGGLKAAILKFYRRLPFGAVFFRGGCGEAEFMHFFLIKPETVENKMRIGKTVYGTTPVSLPIRGKYWD